METPFILFTPITGQTLASSFTSLSCDTRELKVFAVQAIATGSSILGSVQLQGSLDNVHFGNIGSAITLASGNLVPVELGTSGMPYMRAVFTAASGVGLLTVLIAGKL